MQTKNKQKGLAKPFGSMLSEDSLSRIKERSIENPVIFVNIEDIATNPNQPRKNFDEESLEQLAESIKSHGIIQPIIIAKNTITSGNESKKRYILVAGERRLRAAKLVDIKEIRCVFITEEQEKQDEIALIENIQRKDLNPIEEAIAYKNLIDVYNMSQEALSKRIGKSRTYITNSMRILQLEPEYRDLLENGKLSTGHAKELLRIKKEKRKEVVDLIIKEKWSVRDIENYIKDNLENTKIVEKKIKKNRIDKGSPQDTKTIEEKHVENLLTEQFSTKVKIKKHSKRKDSSGHIEISFFSREDLSRILALLTGTES